MSKKYSNSHITYGHFRANTLKLNRKFVLLVILNYALDIQFGFEILLILLIRLITKNNGNLFS